MRIKKPVHICLPKLVMLFSVKTWQCGCGKYFTEEEAEERQRIWLEKEFA